MRSGEGEGPTALRGVETGSDACNVSTAAGVLAPNLPASRSVLQGLLQRDENWKKGSQK